MNENESKIQELASKMVQVFNGYSISDVYSAFTLLHMSLIEQKPEHKEAILKNHKTWSEFFYKWIDEGVKNAVE